LAFDRPLKDFDRQCLVALAPRHGLCICLGVHGGLDGPAARLCDTAFLMDAGDAPAAKGAEVSNAQHGRRLTANGSAGVGRGSCAVLERLASCICDRVRGRGGGSPGGFRGPVQASALAEVGASRAPWAPGPRHGDSLCAICLGDVQGPMRLSCGHTFCRECVQLWFRRSETCPQCRRVVYRDLRSAARSAWKSFDRRMQRVLLRLDSMLPSNSTTAALAALIVGYIGFLVLERYPPGLARDLAAFQLFLQAAGLAVLAM